MLYFMWHFLTGAALPLGQPYDVFVAVKATGLTLRDVAADKFIPAYAEHLKKSGLYKLPDWVDYVKTARKSLVLACSRVWSSPANSWPLCSLLYEFDVIKFS